MDSERLLQQCRGRPFCAEQELITRSVIRVDKNDFQEAAADCNFVARSLAISHMAYTWKRDGSAWLPSQLAERKALEEEGA